MVKKNNSYLKDITEKVGGESGGVHTDNYYLKEIANNIGGGGGGGSVTVDSELSTTSKNPVQNKVITNALNDKADESDIPTKISDLTDDSDFVESNELDSLELVITYRDSTTETVNITTWSDD